MTTAVVLALAGALAVFVLWLMLVEVVVRYRRRALAAATSGVEIPEPTAEELLEAQALGLPVPTRPDPGRTAG